MIFSVKQPDLDIHLCDLINLFPLVHQ